MHVLKDQRLSLSTKTCIYKTLVVSVLLYASETWKLLAADVKTLEAFHMKCQRKILCIRWQDHVCNDEVAARTGLRPVMESIRRRREAIFGPVAIGSAALVILATAGLTNSARTISAHLLTYGEQPSGVVIPERRYGPRRLRDDDDDDDAARFLLQPMQYSPVCGHAGSQCFDEGDRGNWADRWFHGTRVGTWVGHTGPGYPRTRVLTSLIGHISLYVVVCSNGMYVLYHSPIFNIE